MAAAKRYCGRKVGFLGKVLEEPGYMLKEISMVCTPVWTVPQLPFLGATDEVNPLLTDEACLRSRVCIRFSLR